LRRTIFHSGQSPVFLCPSKGNKVSAACRGPASLTRSQPPRAFAVAAEIASGASGLDRIVRYVFVAMILLMGLRGAAAANIEVEQIDTASALIMLDGDLELGDIESFRNKVAAISRATVAFRSDGGSLLAGIRIGMLIRVKNFITVVPDGAQCASACAVAWLGGARRFMGAGSKVGFHAAYVQKGSATTESGPGNAVLGAYLDQLGLPEDAIVYITQAAPSSMKWLSMDEAGQHGIDVSLLPPVDASPPPPEINAVASKPLENLEGRATDFVLSLATRWSGPNADMLRSLDDMYADQVFYHGKLMPRQEVLRDKRRFAEKWPERSYKIRPHSVSTTCYDEFQICRVKAIVERELANTKAHAKSRDVASFEYRVAPSGEALKIAAETSSLSDREDLTSLDPLTAVQRGLQRLLAQVSRIGQTAPDHAPRPSAPVGH
jgi:hypothetical protein